jgi:hypothetical protein
MSGCVFWGEERLEVVHGDDEVAFFDRHCQVDGVEVDLAAEAARQIGAGIDDREELAAAGTDQTQRPSRVL